MERGVTPRKPTQQGTNGKNYLLAIGIDQYDHHPRLQNAVADAQAFTAVLQERYGFELLTAPLLDKEATQYQIRKAIGDSINLTENDRLIIFYSGHGWYMPEAKQGYLVPSEASTNPFTDFIPVSFISNTLKAVKARHVLLVVDCCFGGSFGLERVIMLDQAGHKKVTSDLDKKKSRMVLSSGGIEPVSDGLTNQNNSPFTQPLVDILRENKNEQNIISNIFPELRLRVKSNDLIDQSPLYKKLDGLGHKDGEMVFTCTDLLTPEDKEYEKAITTNAIHLYENFLHDYPDSDKEADIIQRLATLRSETEWKRIENSQHIEDFILFRKNYPQSAQAKLAEQKRQALKDKQVAEEQAKADPPLEKENVKERLAAEKQRKKEEAKKETTRKQKVKEERERKYKEAADKLIFSNPIITSEPEKKSDWTSKIMDTLVSMRVIQRKAEKTEKKKIGRKEVKEERERKYKEAADKLIFSNPIITSEPEKKSDWTSKIIGTLISILVIAFLIWKNYSSNTITDPAESGLQMVYVVGGTYNMGSSTTEKDREANECQHAVTVSAFNIGKYEITQADWRNIMGSEPPKLYNKGCDKCPVESVSWNDIQGFLKTLNAKTGKTYRLPTEEEWEYAARGGKSTKGFLYAGSENLDEVAWYNGNAKSGNNFATCPVGTRKPNELEIYDMSGNVWEWCSSMQKPYPNCKDDEYAGYYVLRGGSWYSNLADCRIANRYNEQSNYRDYILGFRLAHD